MSVYYCPNCGNCTQYGALAVFFKKTRLLILKMIKEGQIKKDEQKFCFICEEAKRKNSPKELPSTTPLVNSCVECFDLQINGIWQRFTYEQKENLRKAFLIGSMYVNGEAIKECPSCVGINYFVRERTENVYKDSFKPFERRKNEAEFV